MTPINKQTNYGWRLAALNLKHSVMPNRSLFKPEPVRNAQTGSISLAETAGQCWRVPVSGIIFRDRTSAGHGHIESVSYDSNYGSRLTHSLACRRQRQDACDSYEYANSDQGTGRTVFYDLFTAHKRSSAREFEGY